MINSEENTSRFFVKTDNYTSDFFFSLPDCWPSRPYEYFWASQFGKQDDTILDAACGVSHPFKFYMAEKCREVYAIDHDISILNRERLYNAIIEDFGDEAIEILKISDYELIKYYSGDIDELPFSDKTFDKIFCISVLEHLQDFYNKKPKLSSIPGIRYILPSIIKNTLLEFKRTLKDDGQIILTFDYPDINLNYLQYLISKIGLKFVGDYNPDIPNDALYLKDKDIYIFRMVLKKFLK
ncbi:MAG: class I SAM-dependent methyltransferase [Methanomicrobiales archaeon]|nr:class I SAM-dependent methyltransferase [Methanomicrobiales archaeon]